MIQLFEVTRISNKYNGSRLITVYIHMLQLLHSHYSELVLIFCWWHMVKQSQNANKNYAHNNIRSNKRQRIPKEQSKMDNAEKLAT